MPLKVLKNDANLPCAYQITAWAHYRQQKLQDALAAVDEVWKYAELSSLCIEAFISQEYARILSMLIETRKRDLVLRCR